MHLGNESGKFSRRVKSCFEYTYLQPNLNNKIPASSVVAAKSRTSTVCMHQFWLALWGQRVGQLQFFVFRELIFLGELTLKVKHRQVNIALQFLFRILWVSYLFLIMSVWWTWKVEKRILLWNATCAQGLNAVRWTEAAPMKSAVLSTVEIMGKHNENKAKIEMINVQTIRLTSPGSAWNNVVKSSKTQAKLLCQKCPIRKNKLLCKNAFFSRDSLNIIKLGAWYSKMYCACCSRSWFDWNQTRHSL